MEPSDNNRGLCHLMQKAIGSFDCLEYNENILTEAVFSVFDNKKLLLENASLLAEWKALILRANKYAKLPFNSKLLKHIKQINAYISQQSLFPISINGFCDDIFKPIMEHIDTHNPYVDKFSPQLAALASVSKNWDFAIYELQISHAVEHTYLKEQESVLLKAGCKTAREAIDFIIEKRLDIVNLKDFRELNDELLEELFEKCPNIKHLMINSNAITKLPQRCHHLETLNCNGCSGGLKSLPDMPKLKSLTCLSCQLLKSLPSMPNLMHLDCTGCIQLESLPPYLPLLKSFKCNSCLKLKELPLDLAQLKTLSCNSCRELKSLPSLPQLKKLDCLHCLNLKIQGLPESCLIYK